MNVKRYNLIGIIYSVLCICLLALPVFILSYAPYVRCTAPNDPITGSFYYRTPTVYRPIEWVMFKTDSQWGAPLFAWSALWGSRDTVETQIFFYAQNIEDPGVMHVNWIAQD
ncbi:hypothetical protein [Gimesia sp.]|uniref:hypothetical protein n=1 Tax=Gimesia sp. TaxID=2024833 RepID=UPI003A9412A4